MSSNHADSNPASPDPEDERLTRTTECSNCGRHFVGTYCPDCGQEADPPESVLGILSVFFRELIDIESGLWPTLRALTTRPGRALARYLDGARRRLMNPGRYLLAAIVVAFGTERAFVWFGMRTPYDERVSASISENGSSDVAPETAAEIQSLLVSTADRVVESQTFLVVKNLLLTGLLGLSVWRLFRSHFERGAQAVAFSAFVVAHTAFLETAAELLYVPVAYLSAGAPAGLPGGVSSVIAALYVAVATMGAFGGGWQSAAKGLFALGWAALEQALVLGIVIGGYVTWLLYARFGGDFSSEGRFELSAGEASSLSLEILPLVAVCLVPFALHAGVELYYRRG